MPKIIYYLAKFILTMHKWRRKTHYFTAVGEAKRWRLFLDQQGRKEMKGKAGKVTFTDLSKDETQLPTLEVSEKLVGFK
jgi:hypothetical protein